jgi:hypothetical protein
VTGFADAESSFSIRVGKDESRFKSLRIAPIFSIELHEKDPIFFLKKKNWKKFKISL